MIAITKLLNGLIGVLKVLRCMILDRNLIILEAINHVLPSIGKNIVCATFKILVLFHVKYYILIFINIAIFS